MNNNGSHNYGSSASWTNINGVATYNTSNSFSTACINWRWSNFHGSIRGTDQVYRYDVPSYEDYVALMSEDFGLGVLYADGAPGTQSTTANAYGYFNDSETGGNLESMASSALGMRGIIVYNKTTFNQIFFPIGYSGQGRRTVQFPPNNADRGYLRYSGVYWRLSNGATAANQYRPISYNTVANPGAHYWVKKLVEVPVTGQTAPDRVAAWDINYFDLSFNPYDASVNYPNGDAVIIKPKIRGTGYTPN